MSRIIGIDYGTKRCGISVTDPLQLIVTGLVTVDTDLLLSYLEGYVQNNPVEKIVFGLPTHADGTFTYLKTDIDRFITELKKKLPEMEFDFQAEYFTSVEAKQIIFQSGIKKKKRRDKALVDKVSAVLILQRYLKHI
jgi:putative Holliday junction resolvase